MRSPAFEQALIDDVRFGRKILRLRTAYVCGKHAPCPSATELLSSAPFGPGRYTGRLRLRGSSPSPAFVLIRRIALATRARLLEPASRSPGARAQTVAST